MNADHWSVPGRHWLEAKMHSAFTAWLGSKAGKAWKIKSRGGHSSLSPYSCGFAMPGFVSFAVDALNASDEDMFKAIKLSNL